MSALRCIQFCQHSVQVLMDVTCQCRWVCLNDHAWQVASCLDVTVSGCVCVLDQVRRCLSVW